jgi:hypothetical protein
MTWKNKAAVRIDSKKPTARAALSSWIVLIAATAKIFAVKSSPYIEIENTSSTIHLVTDACGRRK